MRVFQYKKPKGTWFVEYKQNGAGPKKITRQAIPLAKTREEAEVALEAIRAKLFEEKYLGAKFVKKITLKQFIDDFIDHERVTRSRSLKFYQERLKTFKPLEALWLHEITTAVLRDHFKARLDGKVILDPTKTNRDWSASPSTVNRDRQAIYTLFSWGIQGGYCQLNPVNAIKKLEEPENRLRHLDAAEEDRLIASCPEPLKSLVTVAMRTGMRLNEILTMTRKSFDAGNKTITIPKPNAKSKRGRTISTISEVMNILVNLAKFCDTDHQFLFRSELGLYFGRNLHRKFLAACRRAKIPDFHFHDLRHCFASDALEAGWSIEAISKHLGHSSTKMTEKYAHLRPGYMADQSSKMEDFLKARGARKDAASTKTPPT